MRKKTSNKKKPMSPGKKKFLTVFSAFVFTCFMTCVIIGSYVLYDVISSVNGERLIDLEFYKQNQDQTTIIYANDAENKPVELIRLHGEQNRVWVDMENMSPWMGKAFVAAEDSRFYEHHGVDWVSTIKVTVFEGFKRGGSTITQQLIKNLTGENGRSFNRKYYEIINALNFEKYYPDKDVILEAYMNTVYLSHGCYGVKTAAEKYFGKDISELNAAECASLVAITQSPEERDPLWNPDGNKVRQQWVLGEMYKQGMLTKEEYDEAVAFELIFTNSEKYVAKEEEEGEKHEKSEIQSYYVDYVISSVIKDLKALGYSSYEANKMIYSGGLRIYSSVDMRVQEIMEEVYEQRINFPSERVSKDKKPMQSAMTIMDYSGRIVGIVGGAGEKTQNRSNNRAVSAVRQPGSSIKPLSIYAPAIEENFATWSSKIKNYGIKWDGEIWPVNYGNNPGSPTSFVTTQYALQQSYNTVPAQLLMMMSFKTSYEYASEKFHLTSLNSKIDPYIPSPLATGGTTGGVTSLQMAAAFAAFGNGGKYYKPYCYDKVTDSTGENIILQNKPEGEQILSPETAYIMNEMLRTVMTYGTGRGMGVNGFTTFGKTGTSGVTGQDFDRWCVAGTPYYVGAVWFGYDDLIDLNVSGNPAGRIYKTVMDRVHKNLSKKSFERYTDDVVQRSYCQISGLLAGDGCYSKGTGWYKKSNLPGTCAGCNGAPPVEESTTAPNGENPPTPPVESTTAPTQPPESTTAPTQPAA